MSLNLPLRLALLERYGSQIRASAALGLRESRLSYIVNGHVKPSPKEQAALERAFGYERLERLLARGEVPLEALS